MSNKIIPLVRKFPLRQSAKPARSQISPEALGNSDLGCGSFGRRVQITPLWFCAILHTGQLILAIQNLHRQGFKTHLPLYQPPQLDPTKPPKWRALFPGGYIFINMQSVRRWQVLFSTYGVASILRAGDELLPVPHRLLLVIDEIAKNGGQIPEAVTPAPPVELELSAAPLPPEIILPPAQPPAYAAGDEIQIIDGPLASLRGIVLLSDHARVRVMLSLFGRAHEQDLAAKDVRRDQ